MTQEDKEDLLAVLHHRGTRFILAMVDEIVEKMRNDVITTPIPPNPTEAAMVVYAKRCEAEGAFSVRAALKMRIEKLRMENGRER